MSEVWTGGCQCGAVRYALSERPKSEFCHCSMCRRATGGVFAALGTVPKSAVRWTRGEPAYFASSTAVERGFCARCGTPLTFAYHDSGGMDVTLGSLDDPEAVGPLQLEFAVESRLSWMPVVGGTQQRLDEDAASPAHRPDFRSLQAPRDGGA